MGRDPTPLPGADRIAREWAFMRHKKKTRKSWALTGQLPCLAKSQGGKEGGSFRQVNTPGGRLPSLMPTGKAGASRVGSDCLLRRSRLGRRLLLGQRRGLDRRGGRSLGSRSDDERRRHDRLRRAMECRAVAMAVARTWGAPLGAGGRREQAEGEERAEDRLHGMVPSGRRPFGRGVS